MVLLFLKVTGIDSSMGLRFGQPLCLTLTAKRVKGPYHVGCSYRGASDDDELVEITPKAIRLRKKLLNEHHRKRAERAATGA